MNGVPTVVRIVPAQGRPRHSAEASRPRRLDEVLMRLPVLTHATAVVGVGEDGVPMLWNVQDATSILITGDDLTLPWRVLDAARVSLEGNNTRHVLEITWVTERETRGKGITNVVSPYERTLEQTLRRQHLDANTLTHRPVKGWDGRFGMVMRQEGDLFSTPRGMVVPVEV